MSGEMDMLTAVVLKTARDNAMREGRCWYVVGLSAQPEEPPCTVEHYLVYPGGRIILCPARPRPFWMDDDDTDAAAADAAAGRWAMG